ncbi:MAG: alpha/beta hydrolase [Chloroflexi bacterium]|nr:alpha/beta hydrolase [Chloroflexota bacterium]
MTTELSSQTSHPDQGEDGYLMAHGLRHHYIRWGAPDGDAVIFLHGLMNNARYWENVATRLLPDYTVYAPDLRGHGESEHAPGGYLVWAFAMDLREVVEELDLEAFDLVAHSIGCRVAMSYARDHSHRIKHLVLADMGPQVAETAELSLAGQATAPRGFQTEADALAYFASKFPGQSQAFLRRQLAASLVLDEPSGNLVFRFDPNVGQAAGRAALVEIPYLWESLEHISCPTLIVRAENSDVLSAEIAAQMVERLPSGRLLEIAGSGHEIPLQQPAEFARAVREFIAT